MSTQLIQAAQQALDVMARSLPCVINVGLKNGQKAAIEALRTALQSAQASEPVAYRVDWPSDVFGMPNCYLASDFGNCKAVVEKMGGKATPIGCVINPTTGAPDDVVLDAERGRFLLEWLKRYGLLQAEFGQMGVGEKPEDWWLLHAPWGIDQTRPFLGHGKTPEQAIDAAMLAAKAQKGQP